MIRISINPINLSNRKDFDGNDLDSCTSWSHWLVTQNSNGFFSKNECIYNIHLSRYLSCSNGNALFSAIKWNIAYSERKSIKDISRESFPMIYSKRSAVRSLCAFDLASVHAWHIYALEWLEFKWKSGIILLS